jgi:hypothetical protein
VQFDNEWWWHLRGECAEGTIGRHGGWHARELYVVHSAIRPLDARSRMEPPQPGGPTGS